MKKEKVIAISVEYAEMLKSRYPPARMPDEGLGEYQEANKAAWLSHASYMAQEIPNFIEADRYGKAMRWLGYLQAILTMAGIVTLKQLKTMNMPEGATYDRDA
ncbi:hypothetical protein IPM19_00560 [bacterium]|nr:MAG: hypothetical protein IPM19_00560 [bacterium]